MNIRSLLPTLLLFASWAPMVGQDKPGADPGPKIVLASLRHDFGNVKPGTPLDHTFTFKNEGSADLRILNVAPG
ncbi:MAG: DUF1573 domain-containing protein [Acidobacteria bacterium]|nr:DUF1573 domain-containing protein [Acidobacteriota bacterium]